MPYNPNIQHVYGEVTTGGGGTSDVNVTNDPLNVSVSNTPSVNATVVGTPNVAVTNTPTVNIGNIPSVTTNTSAFSHDGSERLRVGQITTLLDGKILNADNARQIQD